MRSIFLDLGAHHGESILCWAKRLGPRAKDWDVISVEADSNAYAVLAKNREGLKKYFNRVSLLHACASSQFGLRSFYEHSRNDIAGSSTANVKKAKEWNSRFGGSTKEVTVTEINIAALYSDLTRQYNLIVVKIDIEGGEYEVLPRLIEVIDSGKTPVIYGEFHDKKVGLSTDHTNEIKESLRRVQVGWKEWNAMEDF